MNPRGPPFGRAAAGAFQRPRSGWASDQPLPGARLSSPASSQRRRTRPQAVADLHLDQLMGASRPWLSVVMPTYNGGPFVRQALDSIVAQRQEDIEVIVVDDGSTDDTLSVVNSFRRSLNIRVIQSPHVGNWVTVTNRGLQMAEGRHVSFLHQDDVWHPSRLSALRPHFEGSSRELFLVHPVWFLDRDGRVVGKWRCPLEAGRLLPPQAVLGRLIIQNFICILAPVFPRSLLTDIGYLDEELWYTADWDFWLKIVRRLHTCYIPHFLGGFRLHPTSITATESARISEFRQQLETVLHRHLPSVSLSSNRDRIVQAARLSVEVNVALAGIAHRRLTSLVWLAAALLRARPSVLRTYLRDSRVGERLTARLRVLR